MPGLRPDQVQKIHEFIHAKQIIQAIQFYREATGVGLAEAKAAVEEMARAELMKPPSGVRTYDDPILENKIRSLLARRKKVEAVKIFREEYGISLKEAKDAVDRIEASMSRDRTTLTGLDDSAIGSDPFADEDGTRRLRVVLLAAAVLIALCAAGVFLFLSMVNA
jgi:ribosomal protein L7/L12